MAEQSFKSHQRFDPAYHFFLAPVTLINLGMAISYTARQWPAYARLHLWWIVMSFALLVMLLLFRSYALKVQDRVIRLEERLRMTRLLTPAELDASHSLTMKQFVALRFASDSELPALVKRAVTEHLAPKAIKAAILTWRPDYDRV